MNCIVASKQLVAPIEAVEPAENYKNIRRCLRANSKVSKQSSTRILARELTPVLGEVVVASAVALAQQINRAVQRS